MAEENVPADATMNKTTIHRVQVKPAKKLKKSEELKKHYATKLPTIESKAAEYRPMPYTFRVETSTSPVKITNLKARSPPHYMLLDHCIAVLWLLFSPKDYNCPLGIAQLQWALAFLKTIRNRQGEYSADIKTCIDVIEELTLSKYADLSEDFNNVSKLNETVHYLDGAFGSSTVVTQNIPFSLNYSELLEKGEFMDFTDGKSMTSQEAEAQLEDIKKNAGVDYFDNLDSESRHKVVNVLRLWKHDQVQKIKDELRRLRSIEDKMKDIDDNFDGYIEDNLDTLKD